MALVCDVCITSVVMTRKTMSGSSDVFAELMIALHLYILMFQLICNSDLRAEVRGRLDRTPLPTELANLTKPLGNYYYPTLNGT